MNAAFRRVRRALLRLAARAAKERWDQARLDREVQDVLADSSLFAGDSASGPENLSAEAAARYTRLTTRTASAEAQRGAADVLRTTGREFSRAGGRLRQRLVDDVARVLRGNGSVADVEAVVRRRTRQADHAVRTIAQTATGGFDRAATIAQAEAVAGVRYRYSGPAADRAFCQARLAEAAAGVTYTLSEIRALSNGQGLPVELYCGGYNCRHRWVAVVVRTAPAPAPPAPPAPPAIPDTLPGFTGAVTFTPDPTVLADAATLVGRPVTPAELVRAVGAPDGAYVHAFSYIGSGGKPEVGFNVTHPWFDRFERTMRADPNGLPYLYNAYLIVDKAGQPPPGLGASVVFTQARGAHALGIDRIHTYAAGQYGSTRFNGYYTWPRIGYDAELSGVHLRTIQGAGPTLARVNGWSPDVAKRLRDARRLRDMMAFPEGIEAWKQLGSDVEADFDTDPAGYSMTTIVSYLRSRNLLP